METHKNTITNNNKRETNGIDENKKRSHPNTGRHKNIGGFHFIIVDGYLN